MRKLTIGLLIGRPAKDAGGKNEPQVWQDQKQLPSTSRRHMVFVFSLVQQHRCDVFTKLA